MSAASSAGRCEFSYTVVIEKRLRRRRPRIEATPPSINPLHFAELAPAKIYLRRLMSALLEIRKSVRYFGRVRANDGIDLEVQAGEIVGLLSENSSGESTLMKVLPSA